MDLALFSVSYAGFWGQATLDLSAFLARAGELGYRHVMLGGKRPHLSPLDVTPERTAAVRRELDAAGVRCAVVAAYTDFSGAGPAEVPALEMQIAYVERLAQLAQQLGAGIVRVFTAYETPGQSTAQTWDRAARAIRECCDRAAAYGVTLAIQNHHDIAVHTAALIEFLHDVDRPNCRLGFDAWSPALRGENVYEAARLAAPFTACTTNADYVRWPRYQYQSACVNYAPLPPDLVRAVPFGTGFIDYRAFFQGLADGGFDGIASYEICSPIRGGGSLENLDACARQYLDWMKSLATEATR